MLQIDSAQIAKAEGGALLKVDLQLTAADTCFEPWMSGKERPSCKELFEECMQAYMETANLVTPLDTGTGALLTTVTWWSLIDRLHP